MSDPTNPKNETTDSSINDAPQETAAPEAASPEAAPPKDPATESESSQGANSVENETNEAAPAKSYAKEPTRPTKRSDTENILIAAVVFLVAVVLILATVLLVSTNRHRDNDNTSPPTTTTPIPPVTTPTGHALAAVTSALNKSLAASYAHVVIDVSIDPTQLQGLLPQGLLSQGLGGLSTSPSMCLGCGASVGSSGGSGQGGGAASATTPTPRINNLQTPAYENVHIAADINIKANSASYTVSLPSSTGLSNIKLRALNDTLYLQLPSSSTQWLALPANAVSFLKSALPTAANAKALLAQSTLPGLSSLQALLSDPTVTVTANGTTTIGGESVSSYTVDTSGYAVPQSAIGSTSGGQSNSAANQPTTSQSHTYTATTPDGKTHIIHTFPPQTAPHATQNQKNQQGMMGNSSPLSTQNNQDTTQITTPGVITPTPIIQPAPIQPEPPVMSGTSLEVYVGDNGFIRAILPITQTPAPTPQPMPVPLNTTRTNTQPNTTSGGSATHGIALPDTAGGAAQSTLDPSTLLAGLSPTYHYSNYNQPVVIIAPKNAISIAGLSKLFGTQQLQTP